MAIKEQRAFFIHKTPMKFKYNSIIERNTLASKLEKLNTYRQSNPVIPISSGQSRFKIICTIASQSTTVRDNESPSLWKNVPYIDYVMQERLSSFTDTYPPLAKVNLDVVVEWWDLIGTLRKTAVVQQHHRHLNGECPLPICLSVCVPILSCRSKSNRLNVLFTSDIW